MPLLFDDPLAMPRTGLMGLPMPYIEPPDERQVSQADALAETYRQIQARLDAERAKSVEMGLWNPETGLPTSRGVLDIAQQYGNTLLMGTVAPGAVGGGPRVSTRIPTAKSVNAGEVHAGNDLQINTDAIRGTSAEAKVAAKLQGYGDVKSAQPGMDAGTAIDNGVIHFKDNLRWIYDRMDPEVRRQAGGWYDGAHKLTGEMAEQYGVPHEAVAGMTARLSPGTDWYQNVSMARRMLDIHHNQADAVVTGPQGGLIRSYIEGQKKDAVKSMLQGEFDGMTGKAYGQLDSDMQRALFIRSHDEAATAANPANAYYNMIHPEGRELGHATLADKVTPTSLGWQSLDNISTAMNILRNPERANISRSLGEAHKIRSFYNNIIDPNSTRGDVTIDTHAIAASHLLPIGISDQVVEHGMSGPPYANQTGATGLYGVYADAHRLLADELNAQTPGLNILPRQVQSITWEGARGMFPAAFKRSKEKGVGQAEIFRDLWSSAPDAEAARTAIGARRGLAAEADGRGYIPAPDWFTPGS